MNKTTIKYKGFTGSIEIDIANGFLHGKILFVNDLVTYESDTIPDIQKEFEFAVDDYLDTCKALGIEPSKPFKGSLNVRLGESLHKSTAMASAKLDVTMNDFIKQAVEDKVNAAVHVEKVEHIHSHSHIHSFRATEDVFSALDFDLITANPMGGAFSVN